VTSTSGIASCNVIINGSLTCDLNGMGNLIVNGVHSGTIFGGGGQVITINGKQDGTVSSTSAAAIITINNGSCGKVTGTNFNFVVNNAIVEAITGDAPATPILVTAKNSTCLQVAENVTMQSGSTGNYGFVAEAVTFCIDSVTDGTIRVLKLGQPTNIIGATVQSDAGTSTVAINIAGTPITGLGALAISTTEASATATAANLGDTGDYISLTFSGSAGCTGATITLYYQEIVP
jgi:hypothetical protein